MKAALVLFGVLLCLGVQAETPTPTCQNERQCEAMWSAAQGAIGVATGMPNRLVEEARIETHRATGHSRLTGVVTKVLTGQEGYRIIVDLACYRSTQCDELARVGTEVFNSLVIDAGALLGPLHEATNINRLA